MKPVQKSETKSRVIRIIKSSNKNYWYTKYIGNLYTVCESEESWWKNDYSVIEDDIITDFRIKKTDCSDERLLKIERILEDDVLG